MSLTIALDRDPAVYAPGDLITLTATVKPGERDRFSDTLATLGFEGVGLWHAEGTSATKRWAWRDPDSVAAWRRISTKYA